MRTIASGLIFLMVTFAANLSMSAAHSGEQWDDDWLSTIDKAVADESKPILVKFEASWCGPCKLLTEALKDAEAIHLLGDMHPIRIDVDNPAEGAPVEGVSALPTMRMMTASGDVIAEHVGFIEGESLISWLRDGQQQYKAKQAAMQLVKSLSDGPLNAAQTSVLIEMLADRSPRQRAAAAGLLIAYPRNVAASVIDAFEKPKLRTRLAALMVLQRWTAPVEGLDPWSPETITPQRIAELRKWSGDFAQQQPLHSKIHQDAQQEAELELDRLVRRGNLREGVIDSLGLMGIEFLPVVDDRLKTETTDTARERLSAVVYRLVAAPTLAIRLPNVVDQLASMDADPRRSAAKTLSEQARSEDVALLETLFGHSDPLVRELALRGLQKAGGGDTSRLTKLLDDPDKNVRAAVLKVWLDHPKPGLVQPVSTHALRETDSGLLVYYVRLLKELNSNSKESLAALTKLAANEDWQVRAEVAEAISDRVTNAAEDAPTINGVKKVPIPEELRTAARALLSDSDSFVLSKIVPAVLAADQRDSFAELLEVAWKYPAIRKEILPKLTDSEGKKHATEFLVARFRSAKPADRVFALEAMSRFRIDDQQSFLKRGIEDSDSEVQLAAARSLVIWLDDYHARTSPRPPVPQNDDPFGNSGISFSSTDVVRFNDDIPTFEPMLVERSEPGGLLSTIGSLFGSGSVAPAVPDLSGDETNESSPDAIQDAEVSEGIQSDLPKVIVAASDSQTAQRDTAKGKTEAEASQTPVMTPQVNAANKYDQWLQDWRRSPESELPWLSGLRPRLEALAREGGETEAHAMMAVLRLGGTSTAERILELASRTTGSSTRLANLYPWLESTVRRELFVLAGSADDSATLLPKLLQQARRYDPQHAKENYWDSLRKIRTDSLDSSYQLRRDLMLVTTGSEYLSDEPAKFASIAQHLAERLETIDEPPARLLGLSVLAELAPEKVIALVDDDYLDPSMDDLLRRDWARMALASRHDEEATLLAIEMLDDEVLLLVGLTFITEGYEGISVAETGSVEIPTVDPESYSIGRLTVPKISPLINEQLIAPLLQHPDGEVVARATYAMIIMGHPIDLDPLIRQARSEGVSQYLQGTTNLLVQAIAFRDIDDEVPIVEEIYDVLKEGSEYYVRDFYWKIRIMTGPKALVLRKRIRDEVGMSSLT